MIAEQERIRVKQYKTIWEKGLRTKVKVKSLIFNHILMRIMYQRCMRPFMCRMIKRHGGLTRVQQHIFAGIVNGSLYMSKFKMDPYFIWETS